MNEQRMAQLLRDADAAVVARATEAGEMAGRVRQLARKRQRRRRVAAGCSMGVVAVLLGLWLVPPASRQSGIADDATYQALVAEADAKMELARQLRAVETLAQQASALAGEDPVVWVARERNRAAMLLVADGDRKRRRSDPGAAACYRDVLELFPTTYWARVASERLKESEG